MLGYNARHELPVQQGDGGLGASAPSQEAAA